MSETNLEISSQSNSAWVQPSLESVFSSGWLERVRTISAEIPARTPVFPFDGRDPHASEQYRLIRTKIVHHPQDLRILAVTSPQVGDGKSITSVNLAGALALKHESTALLIDADFRRSALSAILDLPPAPGLAEVLAGESPLENAITRVEYPDFRLYFMAAGRKRNNPSEMLASSRWRQICTEFRRQFDHTIIDTPPVGVVADYELVQPVVDGVLMVVRTDHTNRSRCTSALQIVDREKLVGVVNNCVPDWFVTRAQDYDYAYYK